MKISTPSSNSREHAGAGVALLITLAAALCVMAVVQWVDQTRLLRQVEGERKEKISLQTQVQEKDQANRRYSTEIARLEGSRKELDEIVKTNKAELSKVKAESKKFEFELKGATNLIGVYKERLESANNSISQANESIKEQNGAIRKITAQRDEFVAKYTDLAEKYNKVVTDYNTLVEQVKAEQEAAKKAAEKK
jgi:chromosome segregation ATPase